MSKVKIEGNASGTGTLTISAPNTNTDRSLTLPDTAGEFVTADASGNVTVDGDAIVSSTVPRLILSETDVTNGNWDFRGSFGNLLIRSLNDDLSTATNKLGVGANGDFSFDSGYGSVANAYGCRAWVNYDARPSLSVRDSGNVSSVTDHGTGDQSVNFSNSMPDADYAVTTQDQYTLNTTYAADNSCKPYIQDSTYVRVRTTYGTTNLEDRDRVMVVIHR